MADQPAAPATAEPAPAPGVHEAARALLHALDQRHPVPELRPEWAALARALRLPMHKDGSRCTFQTAPECGRAHAMAPGFGRHGEGAPAPGGEVGERCTMEGHESCSAGACHGCIVEESNRLAAEVERLESEVARETIAAQEMSAEASRLAAEVERLNAELARAERSIGAAIIDRDAARKQAEEALQLARQQGDDATHLEAQLQAALAAPLARVAGRVRRVLEGRVRIHLDEEPAAWDGAAEGAPLVVTITRGEA